MEWTVVLAGLARKLLKAHSSHQPERESIFSLCLPIPVPVGSAVSKPCRPASTARGLVVARSCAFAGKENVRGSNSSRAGPHPANRCIVCRSVLLAAQNQWKSTLQTHTRKEQTGERMSSSIRQATQLVDCRNESVTSHESRTLQSRFIYAHQNSLCLRYCRDAAQFDHRSEKFEQPQVRKSEASNEPIARPEEHVLVRP